MCRATARALKCAHVKAAFCFAASTKVWVVVLACGIAESGVPPMRTVLRRLLLWVGYLVPPSGFCSSARMSSRLMSSGIIGWPPVFRL